MSDIAELIERLNPIADWFDKCGDTHNATSVSEAAAALAEQQLEIAELREAVVATDNYFQAIATAWQANSGTIYDEDGAAVVGGTKEIERLCDVAGELVGRITRRIQQETTDE